MAFESYALYPQKTVQREPGVAAEVRPHGQVLGAQDQKRIDQVTTHAGNQPPAQALSPRAVQRAAPARRPGPGAGAARGRLPARRAADATSTPSCAAAMRAELKQLGAMSNTTTLYVTHDYQEALALGDRIAVLREGALVQIGTPEEIWRRPADTFVAPRAGPAGDQPPRRRGRRRPDPARGRLVRCAGVRPTLPSRRGDRVRVGTAALRSFTCHRDAARAAAARAQ